MKVFGRGLREHWHLEPGYLNHGTVGATPKQILAVQRALQERIEVHPARFLFAPESPLRAAAERVARFVGAEGRDLVFVDNTSSGVQTVLRHGGLQAGDGILYADIGYGGVNHGLRYLADRLQLELQPFEIELPFRDPLPAFEAAIRPNTRWAVVDHINSTTGLVFPVERFAEVCRARGVRLLVDGAHAPGSLALDIPSIGADAYVGNLHKWGWTPRSSALLWACRELQPQLHPTVVSWEYGEGFTAEFDSVGTRDPTHHLTAPAALDLLEEVGLERRWSWSRERVQGALARLEAHGAVRTGQDYAMMGSVFLPEQLDNPFALRRRLAEAGFEVHTASLSGRAVLRVAAEIYNEDADYAELEQALFS